MKLRDYQQAAIDAVYDHLRNRDDNPCVVLPTGCHQAGHPILMFDGSIKPVEEIAVGDRVMGPDNNHGGRCPTYGARFVRGHANILSESLKALGLHDSTSETKFIPDCYLTATRQERLELIAGLMDTDGSCHRAGFDYITSSRELAADIVFLSRSLGLAAFTRRKHCVCQTGEGGWYFRVGISGEMKDVPCRLPRKRPPRRRQIKSVNRTGFTFESVGKGNFFGFVLDRDHLYVDGNFVVHHNSGKTPVIATLCRDAVQRWSGRVLVLSHVKELLEQSAETLRSMAPDLDVGVYSAGLKKRDTDQRVTSAFMRQKQGFEQRGKKAVFHASASRRWRKNPRHANEGRFPSLNGWFASCSHFDFGDELLKTEQLEIASAIG